MTRLLAAGICLAALTAGAEPEADLAGKARAFREVLLARHLAPEGVVLYRVDLATIDADLSRGTYPNLADTPTFTGIWAATSCTRAEVDAAGPERDEALADARRALDGLQLLMDVTGKRGLLARGIRRSAEPLPDEAAKPERRWFAGTGRFAEYRWRGDASFDQYANGLLPAAWECRRLFPERTRRLAVDFATRLYEDDFRLIDPDGRRTRFGDLSWRSGLGLNSIAQLTGYAAFALAAALDPDPRFPQVRDALRDRRRVVARARRTNLRVLGITNHSNDMMAWHLYRVLVPLARETADPALADLRHGMKRAWLRVRPDGNAYFAALHCRIEPQTCDRGALAAAVALLRAFPLEKRRLPAPPELARVPRRLLPGRKGKRLARDPVPIAWRPASSFEWKSSPYRVEETPAPGIEYTGLDYLAAYWVLQSLAPPGPDRAPAGASDEGEVSGERERSQTPDGARRGAAGGLEGFLARFRPALVVLSGAASGLEFILDQRRSLIGRGPGVDLALDEPSLERVHAAVEFTERGFRVVPASADAELTVHGDPVDEARLKPGDRFQLGGLSFGFDVEPKGAGPEGPGL